MGQTARALRKSAGLSGKPNTGDKIAGATNTGDKIAGVTGVPCGGCTECCRSGQGLFLHPEQGDDVEAYRFRVVSGRDGNPVFLLETTPEGACVYLGPSGCTIYERRPLLCRSFDCRKHYLILPRQDRDNLVRLGLSSRAVFNAARVRVKTLSAEERQECIEKREEFFS